MLNLIVAPKTQDPRAESLTKRIVKFLKAENVEYSVYFSNDLNDIGENVREILAFGETEFVVIGDDIVLNEFLNSHKDISKIKLGIIPTGAHNDFARYLEIEQNPILAIKNILNKQIEEIDLMLVNDKKVLNNVIIGASVEAEELFEQYGWKSFVTEKIASVKTANKYNGVELTLSSKNNKTKNETIYELVVANGGFSKGKAVSPLSNIKDGFFNLVYTDAKNQQANLKLYKLFTKGEHIYKDTTKQYWLTNLKIASPNNKIKAIVDGKVYNFDKLEINLIENGLKIYK